MTVVERRDSMGRDSGPRDQFPVGMRVLAVDDDPTCLKLLETLLLRCQYHVTTTNQAITALKLLRENKDRFDLVISDVHMPDMDGFKLLELVGLEMDLPVIMLSANGETQAVMKGITHGACDYLLKPVRIEELKNIWQHVIRRRKFETRDHNISDSGEDCDKSQLGNSEGAQGSLGSGASDRNGKLNRKRKDQDEEDDDDGEENMHDNEDPSTQKKPRVVWSVELHRKFVAAVNQLGIDKAVPKRILDLMNVERLTRENVASHLQKYRLYLKRLSAVTSQQANMVAALRGRDPSYLPMGSLDGYANFNTLLGSRQLPAHTPLQSSGVLPRMNNPSGFGLHGFVPSGTAHLGHTYSSSASNPITDLGNLQGVTLPTIQGNQHGTLLQGMPTSLELDQLQQPKAMQEASNRLLSGFSGNGMAIGCSTNSFANVTKSPLLIQPNQQHTQSSGISNQSAAKLPSFSSDPFEIGLENSSAFSDLGRCNNTWQGAIPSSSPANSLAMGGPFSQNDISPSSTRENVSPIVSHMGSNGFGVSSVSVAMTPLLDPVIGNDAYVKASLLGGETMSMTRGINVDSKLLNFRSLDNSKLKWEEQRQFQTNNHNLSYSSFSSSLPRLHINDHIAGNQTLNNGTSNKKIDMPLIGQTSLGAPFFAQDCKIDKSTADGLLNYKDESILGDIKLQGGFGSSSCSLDDLVNAMIKPEHDDVTFMDGDLGCNDIYSLGACM